MHTVSNITLNQITLVGNLAATWPKYSFMYPVIASRIAEDQVLSYQTDEMVEFSVDATETVE